MVYEILRKYGIRGGYHDQHFLIDERVLDRIVDSADIKSHETILEIGAGIGNLTERLMAKAGHVIAVERDPELIYVLKDRFGESDKLTLIHGDVLDVEFPAFDKVVANLPYSISSEITFKLFRYNFKLAILMYQYEFAQRLVAHANSKDYSRLSVNAHYFADTSMIMKIPRGAFSPPPEVLSAVVELKPRPSYFEVLDEKYFLDFVTAVFGQRRKKMRNSILKNKQLLGIDDMKEFIHELPQELLDKRPENLEPEEFAELANMMFRHKQK
ncbi:16S rRNA (adenine(1518)-N(6)/adenine(1519)-N(6))-dimethyltransferase RsmA [Methanolobus bombayensis]|uniref:16S rRNA (adenine(1518)-N(6)/adenine(1519)-N(6))- dimethyltransferase RsmA n=1 Tax=Methanolobus bombayensis TaxID=38023 RepID=UPI001AEA21F3|nr:16S rRNA (adenine(1518)-N(6)/adenine(1519)-N(6))-dimethyltransferase RsmA [Methanolobus bombayensis]MBP1908723.1 16S rRNA (adenine1518-N6/adenine1519-N6)-dimethyltransferase [Methanolobus bombayensis]